MVVLLLTIFNGCQKDDPIISQMTDGDQPQEVVTNPMFVGLNDIAFSVENNRLVFESEEEFQKGIDFLANLGDENFPLFEKEIDFKSYRLEYKNNPEKAELFPDELFQTLLNPEMEIVVGQYLFKEDPINQKTYAYELELNESCNFKSINTEKPDFLVYEDAFPIIRGEETLSLKSAPRCRNNNDKKKEWSFQSNTYPPPVPNAAYGYYVNIKSKLCYQYSAIFKSIIAKIKTDPLIHAGFVVGGELVTLKFTINGTYKYDRKNESAKSGSINELEYVNSSQDGPEWRPFHGTKRVRCYDVTATFRWEIWENGITPQWNGQNDNITFNINCNTHVSECQ